MYLKIDSTPLISNSTSIRTSTRRMLSPHGVLIGLRHFMNVQGYVVGNSQSEISTNMAALEALARSPTTSVAFHRDDDGVTHHQILAAGSRNGIQLQQFNWVPSGPTMPGMAPEFTYQRSFECAWMVEEITGSSNIYSWSERLRFRGIGGPKWKMKESLIGDPEQEQLQTKTKVTVIQSGSNIGWTSYLPTAYPLFNPAYEHTDLRDDDIESAMDLGNATITRFPRRWRFVFELTKHPGNVTWPGTLP